MRTSSRCRASGGSVALPARAGRPICTSGSRVPPRGDVLDSLPRLQGLLRRRAGGAGAAGGGARGRGGAAFAGRPENVVVVPRRSEETAAFVAGDVGAIGCVQADARLDRVRAFVKIQDGCSFSCAFCVIPPVRGAPR